MCFVLVLFCTNTTALSQERKSSPIQVLIDGGYGLGTMKYHAEGGSVKTKTGFVGEVQLQYIPKNVGLSIGAQLSSLGSFVVLNHNTSHQLVHPHNNLDYTLNTKYDNVKEKQDAKMLGIPVEFIFRTNPDKTFAVQGGLGVSAILPMSSSYKIESGTMTNTGYFPATNVTYSDMQNHGLGVEESDASGKIKTQFCLGICADLGCVYRISNACKLYIGAHLQQGLTSMTSKEKVILYDGFTYNGYQNSELSGTSKPFQLGVKLGIILGGK